MRLFRHYLWIYLGAFAVLEANADNFTLKFENREVPPVVIEKPLNPIIYHNPTEPTGAVRRGVIRWTMNCNWKSATLQSSSNLASGSWQEIAPTNRVLTRKGRDFEAVDIRNSRSGFFYRLLTESIPSIHPLANADSPKMPFQSDVAADDEYIYFGNSHGELYRAEKNGKTPPLLLATVNFARLLESTLKSTSAPIPPELIALNQTNIFANDLSILGVAVDNDNIYFSANKIIPLLVKVTKDQEDIIVKASTNFTGLSDLPPLKFYVMVPHSGAVFFIPKALTVIPELTGETLIPIPLAVGLNGAAGITSDATHVYWSCLGSVVDDAKMLERTIRLATNLISKVAPVYLPLVLAKNTNGINDQLAKDTSEFSEYAGSKVVDAVIFLLGGMLPFEQNGAIMRQAKAIAAPTILQDYAKAPGNLALKDFSIFVQPEILVSNLALASRKILLDSNHVFFGENGSTLFGPRGQMSGVRRLLKSGAEFTSLTTGTNKPAFILEKDSRQIFFGGCIPIVGGLLGTILDDFPLTGGLYRTDLTGSPPLTMAPPILFGLSNDIRVEGETCYFDSIHFISLAPLVYERTIFQIRTNSVLTFPPDGIPRIQTTPFRNPSTFQIDECALYITTTSGNTNTVVRVVR